MNSEEKKLIGTWGNYFDGNSVYSFRADGTYIAYHHYPSYDDLREQGFWSIKNGVLTRTVQWSTQTDKYTNGSFKEYAIYWTPWDKPETAMYNIRFGTEKEGYFIGKQYFDRLYSNYEFSKSSDRFIKDRVGSGVPGI